MKAADELAKHVGVKPACAALEVSRSTLYRRRGPSTGQQQPRPTPARALSETERGEVFDTLCSERFVDRSPAEVVATLESIPKLVETRVTSGRSGCGMSLAIGMDDPEFLLNRGTERREVAIAE